MTQFYTQVRKGIYVGRLKETKRRKKYRNTYKRQQALSKLMANSVQMNLIKGVRTFKDRISADALREAWAKGDYHAITHLIPWSKLPEDLQAATNKIGDTAFESGRLAIAFLPPNINRHLRFDLTNPGLRNYVAHAGLRVTQNVTTEAQNVIAKAVSRHFTEGRTPRQIANEIKGSIGLLDRHVDAVYNFRVGLYDKGVNPEKVDDMCAAYEERLLKYRCKMIARTETRDAMVQGQLLVWHEGVNQGYIDRETARKVLVVDGDPCEICYPLDGKSVGLYEDFITEDGENLGDPPFHPHCMCDVMLEFGDEQGE